MTPIRLPCDICGHPTEFAFEATVLGKHRAKYVYCPHCGFLASQEPYWLEEAYQSAIASLDTGVVNRNLRTCSIVGWFLRFRNVLGSPRAELLDYGGGGGLYTRLMRDRGYDCYWADAYCDNVYARGFAGGKGRRYSLVTAFEVFEHLWKPAEQLEKILHDYPTDTLIFSTQLFKGRPPSLDWWYYTFSTGQHISFFRGDTLKYLASRFGFRCLSIGGYHIFFRPADYAARLAFFLACVCYKCFWKLDLLLFAHSGFNADFDLIRRGKS